MVYTSFPERRQLEIQTLLSERSYNKLTGTLQSMSIEEADFSTAFCQPSSSAHDRCYEMLIALALERGSNFCMGTVLYQIFQDAGFRTPEMSFVQPVAIRHESKRLVDLSLLEGSKAVIEAGLATKEEMEQTITQLKALASDETTIFGIARVTQIWARK